jgi:hypothetical protein
MAKLAGMQAAMNWRLGNSEARRSGGWVRPPIRLVNVSGPERAAEEKGASFKLAVAVPWR